MPTLGLIAFRNDLGSALVLVLLPPSEGKSPPVRGRALELSTLSLPSLTGPRQQLLDRLVELCRHDPALAGACLGLGPTQGDEVARNARLLEAPTAPADRIYTGVLYAALELDRLSMGARRRAGRWLVTTSSLFGLVRPSDRIPAYRLSGDVSLPGMGPVAAHWRRALGPAIAEAAGDGIVLDLRSTTYQAFWHPAGELSARTVTARVVQERDGRRTVVSHVNKATKGRLVRSLLEASAAPRTVTGLVTALRDLGLQVDRVGSRLDVVVDEV